MQQFLLACFLFLAMVGAAPAQDTSALTPDTPEHVFDATGISYEAAPDPQTLPALKPFRDRQARFFYMGRTSGVDGWLMMLPENIVQIVYTALDGNSMMIGFIIDRNGKNITEQQMVNLRDREADVNALFTDKVEDAKKRLERDRGFGELMANLNLDKPGDRMYAELAQAPAIELGNTEAPLLLMVIDPQCPFCKKAYRELAKNYVGKNKLLLHVIPVGILGEDSTRMASRLLDNMNDTALWQKFVDSDFAKDVLAGTPTQAGSDRYSVNAGLYNRWKIKGTPFFIYRSKSGTIKVLNEVPADYAKLVNDIAPYTKPAATPAAAE